MTEQDTTVTVQDLFHPSFPAIPWPVRDDHDFQKYVPGQDRLHLPARDHRRLSGLAPVRRLELPDFRAYGLRQIQPCE
jgi:hypothetical protein